METNNAPTILFTETSKIYTDKERNCLIIENFNDKLKRKIELEPDTVLKLIGNPLSMDKTRTLETLKGTYSYVSYDQNTKYLFSGEDYIDTKFDENQELQLIEMVTKNLKLEPIDPYADDYIMTSSQIELEEYHEPKWTDDNLCTGINLKDFIGLKGKFGETIEIATRPHDRLFDPLDGFSTNGYYASHGFNLYINGCNIANDQYIALKCSYNIEQNYITIELISSKEILYFDKYLEPDKPYMIAKGRLPKKLTYVSLWDSIHNSDTNRVAS